jgi:hypothetical protein
VTQSEVLTVSITVAKEWRAVRFLDRLVQQTAEVGHAMIALHGAVLQ